MTDTLKSKFGAWVSTTKSLATHAVADPAMRTKLYVRGGITIAALLLVRSCVADYRRGVEIGPQNGPRVLADIQDVKKLRMALAAWETADHKPLPCTPVYKTVTKVEYQKIQGELPPGWKLWQPGDPIPTGDSPAGRIQLSELHAIAAAKRLERGEAPYGADIFAGRKLDGSPEEIAINPDYPRVAFDNNWRFMSAFAYSMKNGPGVLGKIEWEPVSFRLGKSPYRLYPIVGVQAGLFSGYYDVVGTAGLSLHRP